MMRLAAAGLVIVLAGFPLALVPSPPVTWLTVAALLTAGTGVVLLSVPVLTAGASLALIAYTLALLIARPAVDPLAAVGFGATLVVLPALVHFAAHARGAALGAAVLATQVRRWLATVAAGALAAAMLTTIGALLGGVLAGATLPLVVVTAALGAVLAVAGVIALTIRHDAPRPPA
jgi:hypothetical protein